MSATTIDNLLSQWGLECLHSRFQTQGVDLETLDELNDQDLLELIPQLGLRKKFKKLLTNYKNSSKDTEQSPRIATPEELGGGELVELCNINDLPVGEVVNIVQPITPRSRTTAILSQSLEAVDDISEEPAPKRVKLVKNLPDILKGCINGKIILALHEVKKCKKLGEKFRNLLADIIVTHYISLSPSYNIEFKIFDNIANEIVELFPQEDKEIYYIPPTKKTLVKGKLPNRYHNLRKELKEAGVISKSKTATYSEDEDDVSTSSEANRNDTVTLTWLKSCGNSAWHDIEEKWIATSKTRLAKLRAPNSTGEDLLVAQYFEEYPCLKKSLGYTLLEKDFEHLYPGKGLNFLEGWEPFAKKIWPLILSKSKDSEDDIDEESFDSVDALLRLSEIFTPISLRARTGSKCWKATRAEMQDGFLIHVKIIGDLPDRIQRRKDKLLSIKARCQPSAVVVGLDASNIVSSFVVFDDIRYEVESPLRAIDVCFKAYHSLHAAYPPESEIMWMVIQKLIYKIDTKWDKKSVTLQKMLVDLKY